MDRYCGEKKESDWMNNPSYFAQRSTIDFELYMSFSEDIQLIRLFVSSRDETDIPPP